MTHLQCSLIIFSFLGRTCSDTGCIVALVVSATLIAIALLYTIIKYCKDRRKQKEKNNRGIETPKSAKSTAVVSQAYIDMEWYNVQKQIRQKLKKKNFALRYCLENKYAQCVNTKSAFLKYIPRLIYWFFNYGSLFLQI